MWGLHAKHLQSGVQKGRCTVVRSGGTADEEQRKLAGRNLGLPALISDVDSSMPSNGAGDNDVKMACTRRGVCGDRK